GGVGAESPDGRYHLDVMAPMSPTRGGTYEIRLIVVSTSDKLRRITLTVPRTEETVSLREGGGVIHWDQTSRFADITIGGRDTLRVWAP
ncbi:MAG: hypothetical protein AB7Q45_21940, partial [Planctomycetaceae bacterium]